MATPNPNPNPKLTLTLRARSGNHYTVTLTLIYILLTLTLPVNSRPILRTHPAYTRPGSDRTLPLALSLTRSLP